MLKIGISLYCCLFAATSFATLTPLTSKTVAELTSSLNPHEVELGKKLYFEKALSKDKTLSCNSCHNLQTGGTDNRSGSIGVGGHRGDRKAPTVFNATLMSSYFWDGRADSLEAQAKGPLLNPIEMAMPSKDAVVERLKKLPEYEPLFVKAFGKEDPITFDNVARAIAAFERTLLTPNSPFDRYLAGDKGALSEHAVHGYKLVQSIGCTTCHMGQNFAGPKLEKGTPFLQKFPTYESTVYETKYQLSVDLGRAQNTRNPEEKGMWRVPTWRNVALTPPYFHNGSVRSLSEAVRVMAKTQLNKELSYEEVRDIVAFLESLTGEKPEIVQLGREG